MEESDRMDRLEERVDRLSGRRRLRLLKDNWVALGWLLGFLVAVVGLATNLQTITLNVTVLAEVLGHLKW